MLAVLVIEIFFGYWFSKNNFGIHMKKILNDKAYYNTTINGIKKKYIFERNKYGFRNDNFEANEVDIVFIGGSTTIQRHLDYDNTIVGILNEKFKDRNIIIANAGMAGKSSYGYLCDFNYWFSKIDNLKPKFYIFYTGINEGINTKNSNDLRCEGITSRDTKIRKLRDFIINSSFFISKLRILKSSYNIGLGTYEFKWEKKPKGEFLNFHDAKRKYPNLTDKKLQSKFPNTYENLNNLNKIFKKNNINPLFITQTTATGFSIPILYYQNQITKNFVNENNYNIIKLDEELVVNWDHFIDNHHVNEKGSELIANYLEKKLLPFVKIID